MTSRSLLRFEAPEKSLTSSEARIASDITMRCSSIGSEVIANSTFLNFSRASAHLPWRAKASALHNCEIVVGADRGIGEILQPLLGPADQAARDRPHHQRDWDPRDPGLGVGERQIENALGFSDTCRAT